MTLKSPSLTRIPLPYAESSLGYFEAIRQLDKPILLDSSGNDRGRYDIISAKPTQCIALYAASLPHFRVVFEKLRELSQHFVPIEAADLPFTGGLLGYVGYDVTHKKYALKDYSEAHSDNDLPSVYFGAYGWAIIQDHKLKQCELIAHPACKQTELEETLAIINSSLSSEPPSGESRDARSFQLSSEIQSNLNEAGYQEHFQKVQEYIRAGDCYQINLARRFSAAYLGDPFVAYRLLRTIAAAPYSAYIEFDDKAILSFSPERFIRLDGTTVTTEPIKGTAARSKNQNEDEALAQSLLASEKNRAENLMIVDLLRNDLGQVCEAGSITVDKLFELQSFKTVHHLVSRISGELRADEDAISLLAACFPGGSITGAPKKRATEIIRELEPDARDIFCGSIAMISSNGKMDSNIAIRTITCANNQLHCWAGGGLVADSVAEDEFQETWHKVGKLLEALT